MITESTLVYITGNTTVDAARSLVFGELVKLVLPVMERYHSDLYFDAVWVQGHVVGPDAVTFMYSFDQSGTSIDHAEGSAHRKHVYRIRVWCDGGAVKMKIIGA